MQCYFEDLKDTLKYTAVEASHVFTLTNALMLLHTKRVLVIVTVLHCTYPLSTVLHGTCPLPITLVHTFMQFTHFMLKS